MHAAEQAQADVLPGQRDAEPHRDIGQEVGHVRAPAKAGSGFSARARKSRQWRRSGPGRAAQNGIGRTLSAGKAGEHDADQRASGTSPSGRSRSAKARHDSVTKTSGRHLPRSGISPAAQQRHRGEHRAERDQQRADEAREIARLHRACGSGVERRVRARGPAGRTP